ncbi:hypothetical protein [Mesoterricola sediminis]|uniref:Uncharacterized protein n=1 Tax=Mesoterricola sediminis TaxID=2927980 RepID=A0AA48KDJ8_9BACT|nr:hypothetical protein [Mesoterricola sediminis]BDU76402.1 hypothetical protein METESE_13600 [Mesoterricola sediminis]
MTWLDAFLARPVVPEGTGQEAPLVPGQEGEGMVPSPEGGNDSFSPWDPTLEALCQTQPEDAPYLRAERAAVLTFCAGLPHDQAEHMVGLR